MEEKRCLICGKRKSEVRKFVRDWCVNHYYAELKAGRIERVVPVKPRRPYNLPLSEVVALILEESDKDENGCLNNPRALKGGYPSILWNGRPVRCFRLIWEYFNGPVPGGHYDNLVHHCCHNKLCVNREHLELLSRNQHMTEHWSKYTPEALEEMKQLWQTGQFTYGSLATEVGLSKSQVWGVLNGKRWTGQ